jgi:hypothetical protein
VLTEGDLALFARFKIPTTLLEGIVERVSDQQAREYGITGDGDMRGLAFHYFDPTSNGDRRRWAVRVRRDQPGVKAGNKPDRKYCWPYGIRRHLFFVVPGCENQLANTSIPVIIVEAEKSVLTGTAWSQRNAEPCVFIGTGGCYGWLGKITRTSDSKGNLMDVTGPLHDLDLVEWKNRRTIILFDSNVTSNPQVWRGRRDLAEELLNRGANVQVGTVPSMDGRVNGPDDMLAECGDEGFRMLIETATPYPQAAIHEAEDTVAELEANPNNRSGGNLDHLFAVLAAVEDQEQRELLIGRTAKAFARLLPKAMIRAAVEKIRDERRGLRASLTDFTRRVTLLRAQVVPAELIVQLEDYFTERAYLPEGAALVLAIWAMNTWTFDVFDTTPYVNLESAVPGCGKTTTVGLMRICARPQLAVSIREAALYRLIEEMRPTLLIDEAETIGGSSEQALAVRAVAQTGYKRGGRVPRCEGEDHKVVWFETYCPKLFALIGGLSGALLDRCIVVHMERRPSGAQRKSCREKVLKRDAQPLIESLEAYALQNSEALARLYAREPDEGYWPHIVDREAELWGPLLIHARLAGNEIEQRLLHSLDLLSTAKARTQADDWNIALASELCEALAAHNQETFSPIDLITRLGESWATKLSKCKDDLARAAAVGRFLRRFRLSSRKSDGRITYGTEEALRHISAHTPQKTSLSLPSSPQPFFPESSGREGNESTAHPEPPSLKPELPRSCRTHGIHSDWYKHTASGSPICGRCHPRLQ